MRLSEVQEVDMLHNKLAARLAAYISDAMRDGEWPDSVCNLVFDKLTDAFMEEGNDTLLSVLDDILAKTKG
jgi:hypothetical protein